MTDLLAARTQMAMSLGFHIVFAAIGIAMPVLLAVAEWRWLSKGDRDSLDLAHRWSKGTAMAFPPGIGADLAPQSSLLLRGSSPDMFWDRAMRARFPRRFKTTAISRIGGTILS